MRPALSGTAEPSGGHRVRALADTRGPIFRYTARRVTRFSAPVVRLAPEQRSLTASVKTASAVGPRLGTLPRSVPKGSAARLRNSAGGGAQPVGVGPEATTPLGGQFVAAAEVSGTS